MLLPALPVPGSHLLQPAGIHLTAESASANPFLPLWKIFFFENGLFLEFNI